MGVLIDRDIQDDVAEILGLTDTDPICFNCCETIEEPIVFWVGNGSPLTLHPNCAIGLACALIGDAQALKATSKGSR